MEIIYNNNMQYFFQCSNCNSTSFSRPKGMENLTFLEGHFICDGCQREVPYHDEDWNRQEETKQLTLFEYEQYTGANFIEEDYE